MNSNKVREEFINYFKKQGHKFVKSAPVVPLDDPTLLFTNAGMNQFKDIFLGNKNAEIKRATDYQKCIRASGKHNDLEDVGKDSFHHTFFEMLGNWSFGDYYKEDAINWAWDLLTNEWKLPKDKLYPTIYETDDEAFNIWKKVTSFGEDKILKFGDKDNFWEMGDTGPCGPCSEIHIDLGEGTCENCKKNGKTCGVNVDGCSRFIELWNLVFIQYDRQEDGTLKNLKNKHVDTGMGFERIVRVLSGADSNYGIDIFKHIIAKISNVTGKEYNKDTEVAMRVIADHIRALTFALTDGAIISNEGRNSVLRSILRRASRFGRTVLEQQQPFLYNITDAVVDMMGDAYPEIVERKEHVKKIILDEEVTFNKTIDRGLEHFDKIAKSVKNNMLSGKDVFTLHTQEGFPMDLTRQMAEERGLKIDEAGFYKEMEQHKADSNAGDKFKMNRSEIDWFIDESTGKSDFIGYDRLETSTEITKYGYDGSKSYMVTKETPFYANMGGQIGDKGTVTVDGKEYKIIDTINIGDEVVHIIDSDKKIDINNKRVKLSVSKELRDDIARNHTSTHLLHSALRKVLGEHVTQQGSLVEADRLRFDFSHNEKVNNDLLQKIEKQVNKQIRKAVDVTTSVMSFDDAKKSGAMALFGEKYGDEVRVIKISDFSTELCGGTHVKNTLEIGYFRITSESSIASGIRRIEAVTGRKAFEIVDEERNIITQLIDIMNVKPNEIAIKVDEMKNKIKNLEKENKKLKTGAVSDNIDEIIEKGLQEINGVKLIKWASSESIEPDGLRTIGDKIRNKMKSCVIILASVLNKKIIYVCMVTDDLIKDKGLKAGDIIKQVAKIAGGGGGGKPNQATAGGKDIDKLDESIKEAENIIESLMNE